MSLVPGDVVAFDATPLEMPEQGGVGRYTSQLLSALLARPDAPRLVLLAGRPLPASILAGTLGQAGPQFPNRSIWMQLVLPRSLRRLGPRLCHFTNSIAPLFTSRPYVVSIHDMAVFLHARTQSSRQLLAARGIVPRAARRAAIVVTASHSAREDILRVLDLPPENVRVVYYAAAPEFRPIQDAHELERVRSKYRLTDPFVLHVGTVGPRKNLPRLLDAFAALRQEGRAELLVLAGPLGWKYGELLRRLDGDRLMSSSVKLLGYVDPDDLPALYNLARVVALPSLYEGFGFPILEAMASGVPVVTSNRSAMAEIGADAAVLVDPESTTAMADGLRRLLDDEALRARLRERGLRRAAGFSWDEAARQMIRVYNEAGS